MKKAWLLTSSLCLAPLNLNNLKVEEPGVNFQINEQAITSTYSVPSTLSFRIGEKEKEGVRVYRSELGGNEIQVSSILWERQDQTWIGKVLIQDGDQIQYHVKSDGKQWDSMSFTQDSKDCELLFSVNQEQVKTLADGYQAEITLGIAFQDAHFQEATVRLKQNGVEVPVNWNGTQQASCVLTKGEYELHVEAKDTFQHQTVYDKTIVIDAEKPRMQVLFNQEELKQTPYQQAIEVEVLVDEPYLDQKRSKIFVDQQEVMIAWEKEKNGQKATFRISSEGEHTIRIALQDISGNTIEQSYQVCIDSKAPSLKWIVNKVTVEKLERVYATPPTLEVALEELHPDLENSWISINNQVIPLKTFTGQTLQDGVYTISYHIQDLAGNQVTETIKDIIVDSQEPIIQIHPNQEKDFLQEPMKLTVSVEDAHLVTPSFTCDKDGERIQLPVTWQKIPNGFETVIEIREEGAYQINISGIDLAGHITKKQFHFVIDHTAPSVKASFADDQGESVSFDRTWNLQIKDPYLDLDQSEVTIYLNDTLLSIPPQWKQGNDDVEATLNFQREGAYRILYHIQDKAGNLQSGEQSFYIDKTKPSIVLGEVAHSNRVDVEIPYELYDQQMASYTIQLIRNNQSTLLQGNQNKKDKLILHEEEGNQGVYQIIVATLDAAGNRHQVVTSFVIDKKTPEVQLQLNKLKTQHQPYVTNQSVLLEYEAKDEYLKEVIAQLWKDEQLFKSWISTSVQEQIPVEPQQEHHYRFVITGIDEAGNQIQKEISFTIDQLLQEPMIANDVFQGKDYKGSWLPHLVGEGIDFDVVETTLWKDGKKIPYEWKQEIQEEGSYQMMVVIRDLAMNKNQLPKNFNFTIDHTPPIIQLYDLDHEWFLKDKAPLHTTLCLYLQQPDVTKRTKERFTEILVNGVSMLDQVVVDKQGQVMLQVKLDEVLHITAYAIDEAGNESVFERVIQPVEETELVKQIQEEKQKNPTVEKSMLPTSEKQSDELVLVMALVILTMTILCYGIKKLSAHRHP